MKKTAWGLLYGGLWAAVAQAGAEKTPAADSLVVTGAPPIEAKSADDFKSVIEHLMALQEQQAKQDAALEALKTKQAEAEAELAKWRARKADLDAAAAVPSAAATAPAAPRVEGEWHVSLAPVHIFEESRGAAFAVPSGMFFRAVGLTTNQQLRLQHQGKTYLANPDGFALESAVMERMRARQKKARADGDLARAAQLDTVIQDLQERLKRAAAAEIAPPPSAAPAERR